MKTSLLSQILLWLATVLLVGCAPKPIEIVSFPTKLKIEDVSLEFSGYKVDDQDLTIEICFLPPNEEKWSFDNISLKLNNEEISQNVANVQTGMVTIRADGYNCENVKYQFYWSKL